ncbi:MFS multidrug transporter [Xylogone sp. PMI_703]|nr:MFS multidrug transporter [Xylogone sp. PMI_703]
MRRSKTSQDDSSRAPTFYLAVAAVCICSFMSSIDTVIVASALPRIAQALHADSVEAYWCGTGFLFSQTIAQPIYGVFSSVVGMKSCMMVAVGVFLVASAFCAAAQSIAWLIAARVVQGIGAGGINAMINVIISAMVPLAERGKYIGIVSLCAAVGLVSGVVLGAVFAQHASWRVIFYINLPICTVALLGVYFFIHLPKPQGRLWEQIKGIDWVGVVILSGSLVGVLYGITGGNVLYPWDSPRIIVPLIVGGLGVLLFVYYEHRWATDPIIPLRLFSSRTAASGYYITFIHAVVLWSIAYYLILYFIVAQHHSLVGAAVATLPGMAVVPPMATVCGIGIAITKRFFHFNLFAWICVAIGLGLFATLTPSTPRAAQYGFQIITAVGGGFLFPGRVIAVQAPQKDQGDIPIATTMVSFFTSLGEAFGLGIGSTIFQNAWTVQVNRQIANGAIREPYIVLASNAVRDSLLFSSFPLGTRDAYGTVISGSLRVLWITLAGLSASACLITLLQKNLSTAKPSEDSESSVVGEDENSIVRAGEEK